MVIQELSRDFDKEEKRKGLTFVRGEKINPDSSVSIGVGSGEVYTTIPDIKNANQSRKSLSSRGTRSKETLDAVPKGKKQIDVFMEEIKRAQEKRDRAKPSDSKQDSNEDNSESSNIWIGNIHESLTVNTLKKELEKFGPIANIKIVDPKSEYDSQTGGRKKPKTCAFVLFFLREDAIKAIKALDGKEFHGNIVDASWAKRNQTHSLYNMPKTIKVVIPDSVTMDLIHRVCQVVLKHGQLAELAMIETRNPNFQFLLPGSQDNMYYRWKMYSLLQGDEYDSWRKEPFQMFVNGPYWIPPPQANGANTDSGMMPVSIIEKGKSLSADSKKSLISHLSELTISKRHIRRVMGFSVDHSESAPEIVDIISKHLLNKEIKPQDMVPALYLINDILYNSSSVSVQNIHLFRSGFEFTLKRIFKCLYEKHQDVPGRIAKQGFKDSVLRVLKSWEQLCIYPREFIDDLGSLFLNGVIETVDMKSEVVDDSIVEDEEYDPDIDGIPIEIEDIDFEEGSIVI